MWHFVAGVKPPKRKQTADEQKAKDIEYEAKRRKRLFQAEWKKDRPWLRVETGKDGIEVMFCDFCKAASSQSDNSFVKGCTNMKLYSIKKHETTNSHLFATNKHSNEQKPKEAPAYKAKLSLNKAAYAKLRILFKTTHALHIKGRPTSDYIWMNELSKSNGLDVGDRYSMNVKTCSEFASAIANVQRNALQKHLQECKFVSVIVDGSMDSSITDNEMVYIQTCKEGSVQTNFIYCCQVQRGTAPRIVEAIQRAIETVTDWSEFKSKMVALGSDGASVMLGKNNGVIALLQTIQPSMIAVHCSGHRLELAFKDTLKKVANADKVVTLLSGLFYMYRNSPLNRTNLKNAYRCLDMKILVPTRLGGSRWVGHTLRALNNMIQGYSAIRLHMEQLAASKEKSDSKSKATGFLKLLRSKDIIAMALFLEDLLTVLQKVSLKFQEEGSVAADISLTIKTTITRIKSFATIDGPSLQKLPQFETCQGPSAGTETRNTYRITGDTGLHNADRNALIDLICSNLSTRFEDTCHGVIRNTSVANFKEWPAKEETLDGFGDEMIQNLVDQFGCYLEDYGNGAKAEWPLLRTAVFDVFSKDFDNLSWKQVHKRFGTEYPKVLNLFDLILTIPATSTACERGFSHMKLIKSDRRSLMSETTLSNSLMIKLEGPSIPEFNPDEAIDLWFSKCQRRPGTSGSKENKMAVNEATASLVSSEEGGKETEDRNAEQIVDENQDDAGQDQIVDENQGNAGQDQVYELVQQPNDSDYESDYNSEDEDANEIFDKIANF